MSSSLSVIETKQLYLNAEATYSKDVWFFLEKIFIDGFRRKKIIIELIKQSHPDTFILGYQKNSIRIK